MDMANRIKQHVTDETHHNVDGMHQRHGLHPKNILRKRQHGKKVAHMEVHPKIVLVDGTAKAKQQCVGGCANKWIVILVKKQHVFNYVQHLWPTTQS